MTCPICGHEGHSDQLRICAAARRLSEENEALFTEAKKALERLELKGAACDEAAVAHMIVETMKYAKPWQFKVRRETRYEGGKITVEYSVELFP